MQDLKDVTEDSHYENYRAQYITKISQHAAKDRTYVLKCYQARNKNDLTVHRSTFPLFCNSLKHAGTHKTRFVGSSFSCIYIKSIYDCNAIYLSFSVNRKLKRDSAPSFEGVSETDRLLLQKDEEVSEF